MRSTKLNLTLILLLSLGAGSSVRAQQAAPGAIGALAASSGNTVSLGGTQSVTDVFLGRNVIGPYLLSWKGIEQGTEVVSTGGRRLARGIDYQIDPAAGTLTFTIPLPLREVARVDYQYTPGKAAANSTPAITPLDFNLLRQYNGALTLNALFRPDATGVGAGAADPGAGLMLGFGGNAVLTSQSTLASKLFVDARGGNLMQRSGLQLTEKTKTRYGLISANFARAGSEFQSSSETGIAAGSQVLDLNGTLNPIHGIQAAVSFKQTTNLPAQGQGATTSALGERLSGALTPTTRFQASRTETTTASPNADAVARTINRIQLDQKLTDTTQATAVVEHNETASGDSRSVTQTNTLSIRSQPSEQVSLTGTFQNRLLPSGAEDSTNVRVEADPTQRIKLTALLGERYNHQGALHSRQADVEYAARKGLTLTGSVYMRAQGGDQSMAGSIGAAARPSRYVEVNGDYKLRNAMVDGIPDPTVPNTYNVRLSVTLPRNVLRLTGGYASNPEDDKGIVSRAHNQSVGLQSSVGSFDFGGTYTLQNDMLAMKIDTVRDLMLGWRLARTTRIQTSWKEALTLDQDLLATDTYSLSLSHRVGSLLDLTLSGMMTTYAKDGILQPTQDYEAQAKLGMRF